MRRDLIVFAALAACADPAPDLGEAAVGCPDWGCGSNAASMGERIYFHELEATGAFANSARVRVTGFRGVDGTPLSLFVDGDDLTGRSAGGSVWAGVDLVGATIRMERDARLYEVRIGAVGWIPFWVAPGLTPVTTYTFEYRPLVDPPVDYSALCTGLPGSLDPEWTGVEVTTALVFRGDWYDAATKSVHVGPRRGHWFNVACAGSAVAKMHLLRHTQAASDAAHATTQPERQAMLKMITDDLCGTGRSFTRDGEEVHYMDRKGWHPFDLAAAGPVESIWDERGAVCLTEPRRLAEDPGVWDAILAECGADLPPACPIVLDHWTDLGYGISANP
jgi:hypothetical protein